MHDVSIVSCRSYQPHETRAALISALEPIGGLDFLKKGDVVAIKANLVSPKKPEKAATTHPQLIASLCELIIERGASVIVGDSPGGVFGHTALTHTYIVCGLEAARAAGAELNDDFTKRHALFPQAKRANEFLYTAYLDKADYIIDFCKLKTHGMFGLTAGIKNMFGVIPGAAKSEYHYRFKDAQDFSHMLVDLCEFTKPVITLVDAVEAMEGNGPNNGTPKFIGALIAAKTPYSADLLIEKLLPLKTRPATTAAAIDRGLCPDSADKLAVFGNPEEFYSPDFKLIDSEKVDFSSTLPKPVVQIARRLFGSRPKLRPEICVGCKECALVCPADAISIKKGKAAISRKKCIRCFCCQEFCPRGAFKVARSPLVRLLTRPSKSVKQD